MRSRLLFRAARRPFLFLRLLCRPPLLLLPFPGAALPPRREETDLVLTEVFSTVTHTVYSVLYTVVQGLPYHLAFWVTGLGFKKLTQFGDTWMEVQVPGGMRLGFVVEETVAAPWHPALGGSSVAACT